MNIREVLCLLNLMLACNLSVGCGSSEPTVIQPGTPYELTEAEKQKAEQGEARRKMSFKDQLDQNK